MVFETHETGDSKGAAQHTAMSLNITELYNELPKVARQNERLQVANAASLEGWMKPGPNLDGPGHYAQQINRWWLFRFW